MNSTQSKAYAGGAGGVVGLLASQPVAESLTQIVIYLLSFLGAIPVEVQEAIATLIQVVVVGAITYGAVYIAPPNQVKVFPENIDGEAARNP